MSGGAEEFNKQAQVVLLLEMAGRRFRDQPSRIYLEMIAKEFMTMKIRDIEKLLTNLHARYDKFPTLHMLHIEIKNFLGAPPPKPKLKYRGPFDRGPAWVSKKAPGTPPSVEALFQLIESNETSGPIWMRARNSPIVRNLSDDDLWICFQAWCEGEVHALIQGRKPVEQ